MVTWGGDANMDGKLDGDDFFRIDSNVVLSETVFGFANGDFNYDDKVDFQDLVILSQQYSKTMPAIGTKPLKSSFGTTPITMSTPSGKGREDRTPDRPASDVLA